MARSKKAKDEPTITPELPGVLRAVQLQAEENSAPVVAPEEATQLVMLLELIIPGIVVHPMKGRPDTAIRQLREPLLMISWDRAVGAWKWAVNDRVLRYTISGHLESLLGLAEGIESCLANGKFAAKSNELT